MRYSFLLTMFCVFSWASYGQNQGKITYQSTTENKWNPENPFTQSWELSYNDSIAICIPVEGEEQIVSAGGMEIKIFNNLPEDRFVTFVEEDSIYDYRDLYGKGFKVQGEMPNHKWKMTGNQGMVMGFPCLEATTMLEDSTEILVWFTPVVTMPIGPVQYRGLPGLVLYVDINNGEQIIAATKMSEKPGDLAMPEVPKGKKIGPKEFEEIRMEKEAMMEKRYGDF